MNFKKLFLAAGVIAAAILSSCSSHNDELLGSWSRSFSLKDDYASKRAISVSEDHETYFHTFTFSKGDNGMGTFTDNIAPMIISPQHGKIILGSMLTGQWEVKDNKLFLYFDDNVTLTNGADLSPSEINAVETQIGRVFLSAYKELAAQGIDYTIEEHNGKQGIKLDFGPSSFTLIKKIEDNK